MSFFLIFFSIFLVAFWWFTRVGIQKNILQLFNFKKSYIYFFDAMYMATLVASILYRQVLEPPGMFMTALLRLNYLLMGIIWLYLLLRVLTGSFFYLKNKKKPDFNPSRRNFLKQKLAFGGAGILVTATSVGLYQAINPEIEEVTIELPEKHKNLSGLKIAQLSDIHIGPTLKSDFLEDVVQKANQLDPDIIVITGDMVDGKVSSLGGELMVLEKLKAKLGVYFITGNHEYYWNAREWTDYVKNRGITVLANEHKKLNYKGSEFILGGVNDIKAHRFGMEHKSSPKEAAAGTPDELYKILLAHQPISCYEAEKEGWNLQLSGHTHGGQGYPWNIVVALVQPYLKGYYRHKSMDLYVNRGTGFWGPPYRLGIPGEVTHMTLV